MAKVTIQSHYSFRYSEVYEIVEWRDGCVFKTKSIGFIHNDDAHKFSKDKYILSSLSTKLTRNQRLIELELI